MMTILARRAALLLGLCGLALAGPGRAWAQEEPAVELCPAAVERGILTAPGGWLLNGADFNDDYRLPDVAVGELGRLVDALSARGVALALVLLPTRGVAVPAAETVASTKGYDLAKARASYQAFLETFEDMGVITVDLGALAVPGQLPEPFFFARDHHWTPTAAQATASLIAAKVADLPVAARLPRGLFRSERKVEAPRTWPGSNGTTVQGICPGLALPDLSHPVMHTVRLDPPELGLLDDAPTPSVVVTGTSNSSWSFNFSGYLSEALSTDVLRVFEGGAGPLSSLMGYLRSDDYVTSPPALIVWEWQVTEVWVRRPDTPLLDDMSAFQQLVPSAYGPCPQPVLQGSATLRAGETVLLQALEDAGPVPANSYLVIETDSPSLNRFDLVSRHSEGQEDRYEIAYYGRVDQTGRFYQELRAQDALGTLVMEVPEGVEGRVETTLCGPPAL